MGDAQPLLEVTNLSKYFYGRTTWTQGRAPNRAVDNVSLTINPGETVGLVGESGCGKSTLARCVVRLLEPDTGVIRVGGIDISHLKSRALRPVRRRMQMVFQDPYGSLNPRKSIGRIIADPLRLNGLKDRRRTDGAVSELLTTVGLSPAYANRLPSELSGGQRQRVGIARALALKPKLLVLDEPVSSLDVSIQAQIINLLDDLQIQQGLAYLFISHNLGVVRHICDRISVMYLGSIVESAGVGELFAHPRHPYTAGLLSAVPVPDPIVNRRRTRLVLQGDVPTASSGLNGCRFQPRCPRALDVCMRVDPQLLEVNHSHLVACHNPVPIGESSQIGTAV